MASANKSTRKRTPDSHVDDSSGVPTPKRTCERNSNVEDVNDQKKKMIQSQLKEDNPAAVLALSKLLSCDACNSILRVPILICDRSHKICNLCWIEDDNCTVEGCRERLVLGKPLSAELAQVIHTMKLPLQCWNSKNGCPKVGNLEEVREHEIECEFRFVEAWFAGVYGTGTMFKDLLCIMAQKVKKFDGKWQPYHDEHNGFYRFLTEPDGHIFCIDLDASDESLFKAHAVVIGGRHVANKYRVKLRLYSSEMESTLTHHGPVFPVDFEEPYNNKEAFIVDKKKFALFNKGSARFGDHNKGKNGEIIVPIMVNIIKKELDIPKEDSSTLVDKDVK